MTNEVKIKMVEYFSDHWYKAEYLNNGVMEARYIPSVTSKLGIIDKPFLARWRGDINNREADMRLFESQQRGTRIHHAFNILINGGLVIYNPWQHPNYTKEEIGNLTREAPNHFVIQYQDEMLALIMLKKWLDTIKPEILFSERTVYSLENNDAGTLDLACVIKSGRYAVNGSRPLEIPEGKYICDLKTGNQVSDEADLQTAAYLKCAEEMNLGKFAGTIILHTGSKNKGGIEGFATRLRMREEIEEDYKNYRLAAKLWEWKHKDDAPRLFEFPSLLKMEVKSNGK